MLNTPFNLFSSQFPIYNLKSTYLFVCLYLLCSDRGSEEESKDMEFLDPSAAFLINNNNNYNNDVMNVNPRKRARESSSIQMVPTPQTTLTPMMNWTPLISTGLRLSSSIQENIDSQLQQELTSLITQQTAQLDHFIITQQEHLKRTLADKLDGHYRALLAIAQQSSVARRLKEKETELNRAARRTAELEERINQLRTESLTWQSRAVTCQSAAASLHVRIQHAKQETAGDAESAHVDPNRGGGRRGGCRACHVADVSVVVLPCRHLCLCAGCDQNAAAAVSDGAVCCPVCHVGRTGSVQVFFS